MPWATSIKEGVDVVVELFPTEMRAERNGWVSGYFLIAKRSYLKCSLFPTVDEHWNFYNAPNVPIRRFLSIR